MGTNSHNVATGHAADARGNDFSANVSTGFESDASGNSANNVASGRNADASGERSTNIAIGAYSSTNPNVPMIGGDDKEDSASTAIGGVSRANVANNVNKGATASGTDATAIGASASAIYDNSTALGVDATATRENQVVLGTGTSTHTLSGVASGASSAAQGAVQGLVTTDANGNLASDGGALQNEVSGNTATNITQQTAIQANTDAIANLGGGGNNNQPQVDANTQANATQQTAIDANTQANATQQTTIDTNTQTNTAQQTAINANKTTGAANKTAIDANTQTNATQQTAIDANTQTNTAQQTAINANKTTGAVNKAATVSNKAAISQEATDRATADVKLQTQIDRNAQALASFEQNDAQINQNTKDIEKNAGGIATALAMQMPALAADKNNAISFGFGHFEGHTAVAGSGALRLDANTTLNGGVGYDVKSKAVGVRGGVTFSW